MTNVKIQSNIKIGLQEILEGIAQLETNDIELFLKEVADILAKKKEQQPTGNKETFLINQIRKEYPKAQNKRYQILLSKIDKDNLSEKEQQELVELSDYFEELDGQRLQYLLELARLRNQPLDVLLKEFPLSSSIHA